MKPLVLAVACFCLTGTASAAQLPADEPWVPWVGCWTLLQEGVRDESPSPQTAIDIAASLGQAASGGTGGIRVCVTPAGAADAFTLTTMAEGAVLLEETIVADGAVHAVEEPGCAGERQTEWSADGQRLFMRTAMACAGEPRRTVSGVSLMTAGATWLDVQAIDVDGRGHVRVRRYGRAWDEAPAASSVQPELLARAASAARVAAAARLDIGDVIEASAKASPRAVEAMLAEARATFRLNRDTLVALDDAGVDDNVIDLMVALTYPEKFVVERPSARSSGSLAAAPRFPLWMDSAFGPIFDPLVYPYWFADMSPFAYAPFGYSYWWGRYDPYFLWGPTAFGRPEPGEEAAGFAEGRAVDNRGYTRVVPRTESSGLGYARPRGSGDGATASAGGASSGGSSGGAVSPKGYSSGGSSGGSGGDTGRTAQPRQP